MSYETLVASYEAMYRRLLTDGAIATRIRNKLLHMQTPLYSGEYAVRERIEIVAKLLLRGILPGGPVRWWHFTRTLAAARPHQLPMLIMDWIAGLSMHDYVRRNFAHAAAID